MSVKVFALVVISTNPDPVLIQVGGNWWDVDNASGDINGGDFWRKLGELFPAGCHVKEIRIVPDEPIGIGGE